MARPEQRSGRRPTTSGGSRRPGSGGSNRPGSKKSDKKKDDGGGILGALGRLPGDTIRNAEEIITGLPSGAAVTFDALDKAMPASPLRYVSSIDKDNKRGGDRSDIKVLGKAMALAMKEDIRHPLRNPLNTALTLAAIPSLAAGTGARAGAAVSAARTASAGSKLKAATTAAHRKPMATRTVRGIRDPQQVLGDRYRLNLGRVDGRQVWDVVERKPARSGPKQYMEDTSFNPLYRGLRKVTIDPIHKRSIKKASDQAVNPKFKKDAKIVTHGSKEYDNITRGARTAVGSANKLREAGVGGVKRKNGNVMVIDKTQLAKQRGGGYARMQERRIKEKRERYSNQILSEPPKPKENSAVNNILRGPMDLLKMNMYLSGRYTIQNNISTGIMNALGGVAPRHIKYMNQMRKNDPEGWTRAKGAMGQTATGTYAQGSGTGTLGKATRKMGEIMSHPEGVQRTAMLARIAEDMGIDPPTLSRLLANPNNNRTQVLLQRANERVGDLGRYGGKSGFGKFEGSFVNSGLPIFYPMVKAFTRYTGKMPLQYPAKTAALAQLGTMGSEAQKQAFGGEPNPYYGYYVGSNPGKSLNPQNILPWSPGGDVIRQVNNTMPGQSEDLPFLNAFNQLGPLPEVVTTMATGRELSSGFPTGDEEDLDRKGAALLGLEESLRHLLPFNEFYLNTKPPKAHPDLSIKDKLAMRALGPGLWERPTDYKAIKRSPKKKRR